jgi:hypothetical protein
MFWKNLTIVFLVSCLVFIIISTTGCKKKLPAYYDLLPTEIPQGKESKNMAGIMHRNVRSVKIYNQFSTEAIFDVLAYNDEVQMQYVDSYSKRHGLNTEGRLKLFNKQQEEIKKQLVYYVLADIRDVQSQSLLKKDAAWSLYLLTPEGKKIEACEIKEVELEPELRQFFLHKHNRYKVAYKVTFPSIKGITPKDVIMVIASVTQERQLNWAKPEVAGICGTTEMKDEDFYWG